MKEFAFTVIIEPDNGSYHAYLPALKGCHTFGATLEEAQTNIVEAMQPHLESMLEMERQFPTIPAQEERKEGSKHGHEKYHHSGDSRSTGAADG
jgi:predicted RNase H-like HicB family nuclease